MCCRTGSQWSVSRMTSLICPNLGSGILIFLLLSAHPLPTTKFLVLVSSDLLTCHIPSLVHPSCCSLINPILSLLAQQVEFAPPFCRHLFGLYLPSVSLSRCAPFA